MNFKKNYTEFQQELLERKIDYLVHFTPTINLLGIFEQGKLLSRALIEEFDIAQSDILDFVKFTDEIRYDDNHYINLSIQHPNSYLFARFRERTQNESHINWCVLRIDKKYIYYQDTLFSVTNAANRHNYTHVGVSGDIEKFRMMFNETIEVVTSNNRRTVTRNTLKSKYPTDEQAEILVKNEILSSDILQVCFEDENSLASGKAALCEFDTSHFCIDVNLFRNQRK